MKDKIINIALLFLSTIVCLLILEFTVRAFLPSYSNILKMYRFKESERGKFARYDAVLGWDGVENVEGDFQWIDTQHHVRHNRMGYRGSEYGYQRTDKSRVLVLGDSFVWGFGVEDKDIFTSVIEDETNAVIEMINLGVSGYGNDQEYLLWRKKGNLWNPDIVLLMITLTTDPWDNILAKRYGYPKPVYKLDENGNLRLTNVPVPKRNTWNDPKTQGKFNVTFIGKILRYSAFANLVTSALSRNDSIRKQLERYEIIPVRLSGYSWEYQLYLDRSENEVIFDVMFKLIEMLNNDVTSRGSRLIVGIIPSVIQVYPELFGEYLQHFPKYKGRLDTEAPNKRIADFCSKNNIQAINLLPGLREAGKSNPYLYFPINRHWTRDGHRVVSGIIQKELGLVSSQ